MDFQRTDSMNDLLSSGGSTATTTDTTTTGNTENTRNTVNTENTVNNITVEKNITSKIEENIVVPIKKSNSEEPSNKEPGDREPNDSEPIINKEPINKKSKKKNKKKKSKIKKKRCTYGSCKKKLSLVSYPCKCGMYTCGNHKNNHECTYDHRAASRKRLENEIISAIPKKMQRI